MKKDMIAPCGMNCMLCMAYLRDKKVCPGCNGNAEEIFTYCRNCIIRNCDKRNDKPFCFVCDEFPCKRLKALDKRYKTKYEMSMIENLEFIKEHGIKGFLENEEKRWVKDGKIYCVHRKEYREKKKSL